MLHCLTQVQLDYYGSISNKLTGTAALCKAGTADIIWHYE